MYNNYDNNIFINESKNIIIFFKKKYLNTKVQQ